MTQNSTLPEDGQPKHAGNAEQHLSSGPGQETQAAAPHREQTIACPASDADTGEQHAAAS